MGQVVFVDNLLLQILDVGVCVLHPLHQLREMTKRVVAFKLLNVAMVSYKQRSYNKNLGVSLQFLKNFLFFLNFRNFW